jgi:hypothetical protein
MKLVIIALSTIALANSAIAGFASVNGHQVYFGQSGHWAIQYPDEGGEESPDVIYRGEGQSWSFPQDQDNDGQE